MRWQKLIIIGAVVSIITGCGSTTSGTAPAQSNINVPEAYQVMADFDIISQSDANRMAKSGKMALTQNINNFNTSVVGQLSNSGSMFIGYGIAQLFGGGVSLMDFFNPAVGFQSTAYKNKLQKPYLFIPVDRKCDEECVNKKLLDITDSIAKHMAENYARQLDALGIRPYEPITVSSAKEIEPESQFKKWDLFSGDTARAYDVTFSGIDEKYADELNQLNILNVIDGGFFYVNGQRYYGSKISTTDNYAIFLRLIGFPEAQMRDNSLVLGMVKASEEHDFIYISTLRAFLKNDEGKYAAGSNVKTRSLGDFMIKNGKYTQLGIYSHPDNQLQGLDTMNHLNVKIGHALDDLVEEVLAEEAASSSGGAMTPSSDTD
jgi:hypothetical protein